MSTPKKSQAPAGTVELYDKLVATNPKIERKGAANPYTSLNGNMFSYLHPSGSMALRLPEGVFEAYGVVQKEYVTVPDSLLRNTKELQKYFEVSYAYAQSLKPKATKKK
jgi:hypothetical protein